jgi:diguanylate cyclase (GGDEF)-like protein
MSAILSDQHAFALVENCPFPLLVMDGQARVLGYNHAFGLLVGPAQASGLQGNSYDDLENHPVRPLLGSETTVCWTGHHSEPRHFEITTIRLDEKGAVHARMYVDISRQVALEQSHDRLNEELRQNILTDRITGLLNQRGIMLALEPQVARSRRYNSPMAVIIMEVICREHCDRVNLHIARLLKDQLRWADLIGCSEKREFLLVLPETTPEAAVRLADKLTQLVQGMTGEELGGQPVDTIYGVTGWRRSDSADSLLSRAGMALAQARSAQNTHAVAL